MQYFYTLLGNLLPESQEDLLAVCGDVYRMVLKCFKDSRETPEDYK